MTDEKYLAVGQSVIKTRSLCEALSHWMKQRNTEIKDQDWGFFIDRF